MKTGIEEYSNLNSHFHRWDARYKLVGLILIAFAFSFIQDIRLIPAMVVITATIYLISGLPGRFILKRLRLPSFIVLALVLTLPFLSGESELVRLGPIVVWQEGLLLAVLIAFRFVCIVTIGIILLETTPLLTNIKAMRALGLPLVMTDMAFLTFRYLHELAQDLNRMLTSMRLRGFHGRRFSLGTLKTFAWLSGSLLVRSYERSEWVYRAMILRGYGQPARSGHDFQASLGDALALGIAVIVATALVVGDISLGHNILS